MPEDNDKKYPSTTPEVARMMGLPAEEAAPATPVPVANLPVIDLPVAPEQRAKKLEQPQHEPSTTEKVIQSLQQAISDEMNVKSEAPVKTLPILQIIKVVFPYVIVFAVGIFLYFFFFTKVDFSSVLKTKPAATSVEDTALLQLEKQNWAGYNSWMATYYYDVSDPAVLDPNADNSGNGLSNFQKYLLDLNPKAYDTLHLGMADSQALANGINPNTGLPLNDTQKQILNKYFDLETIMNKLTLEKMNGSGSVAGASVFGIQSAGASSSNSFFIQDPNAVNANNLDINQNVAGSLQIPSLNIKAPLIFSQTTASFDKDLLNGVIHYPGTALPGQIGTAYISGHSSNYAWVKSNYNHVFTHLGDLANNTSFQITVTLNSGKTATLHYVVTGRQEYSPTDQAQFANSGKSVVALSTCWPVGSTANRLVVYGELTQVDQ